MAKISELIEIDQFADLILKNPAENIDKLKESHDMLYKAAAVS